MRRWNLLLVLMLTGCSFLPKSSPVKFDPGKSQNVKEESKQNSGVVAMENGIKSEGNTVNLNFNSGWVSLSIAGIVAVLGMCMVIHAYTRKPKRQLHIHRRY